jgi:hypothetical protein
MESNSYFDDVMLRLEGQRFALPPKEEEVLIRVYKGNSKGAQSDAFDMAINRVIHSLNGKGHKVSIKSLDLKQFREQEMHFSDVIDWLLGSHIHFIITHPHQGLETSGWSVQAIYNEVQRLTYHEGFPSMEKLSCPIFCQDKWEYLQHLPDEMTMLTHMIPLFENMDVCSRDSTVIPGIGDFIDHLPTGTTFIMKAPFVTNRLHYHSGVLRNISEVILHLCSVNRKMYITKECFVIPYIMLQVRVACNNEVKVIFLDGKFNHIMSANISNVVKSLPSFDKQQIIKFAADALECVSHHNQYILDGLVRVDIFENNASKTMVVNELESLEATFFTINELEIGNCHAFLLSYWEEKILHSIKNLLNGN